MSNEEQMKMQQTFDLLRKQLLGVERTTDENHALAQVLDVLESYIGQEKGQMQELSKELLNNSVLNCLGNDYTAVFLLDSFTGTFDVIINQVTNHSAKVEKQVLWDDYVKDYADKYVLDDSCLQMKRMLSVENIQRHFLRHNDLYFRFHTLPNDKLQRYFEVHAVPKDASNTRYIVLGFRCVDRIVAKERVYQKQLDGAYLALRKQMDIISSSLPGGIKISRDDESYSFKYVSTQYARMLGYSSVSEFLDACGGTIAGIAHPDDLRSGIKDALSQYEKSNHYAITYRMRCKNGNYKYIEDHGHKVVNADGTVEHWNLILDKDELVQKTMELELAKKADEMKTRFMSRMSHDIRTPLNGIIGMMEYAERHPDNKEQLDKNAHKAKIAAKHLLNLVNDILELNKLDEKDVALPEEITNFCELWQDVRSIADMNAKDRKIELIMPDCGCPETTFVYCSPLHVKQILINLISNAIKYNRAGGFVRCEVEHSQPDAERLRFHVAIEDNGIGMSQEFLRKIFRPFVQAVSDEARTRYSGSGLGMAIVKSLVERMGGTINVYSEQGKGTKIDLHLTFAVADEKDIPSMEIGSESVDLHGVKVLLVEDNKLNRDLAQFLLEDAGIDVVTSSDGAEALECFEESKQGDIDIILMDIMMPVMDGIEATKKIRALKRADAKTIPIFAMTANAFADDVQAVKAAGMNEHVAKPVDSARLLKKIYQYVHK